MLISLGDGKERQLEGREDGPEIPSHEQLLGLAREDAPSLLVRERHVASRIDRQHRVGELGEQRPDGALGLLGAQQDLMRAQQRTDARPQLRRLVRLSDVVVGPGPQRLDHVLRLLVAGEHQDRHGLRRRITAQILANLDSR